MIKIVNYKLLVILLKNLRYDGGQITLELGTECQTSNAVLRTMLLHVVGLTPVSIYLNSSIFIFESILGSKVYFI